MTLRVAIDARELEGHATGVGRVVAGLLEAWPEADDIALICRRAPDVPRSRARLRIDLAPGPERLPGSLWEQFVLPGRVRRAAAQVLVCPAYGMPATISVPTAVCMHDCAFASIPDTFRPRERWRRRLQARLAARRAAFLFMGSEFAAAEARRHLGVTAERTVVLPWGVSPSFRPPEAAALEAIRARFQIADPTVLFVGARLQRRQLPMLAAVVGRLRQRIPGLRLLIVGEQPVAERLEPIRGDHVRWLGWVSDTDLTALYAAATLVAYPSSYEGFGLPVLEAMACGTAVIAADCAAPAEVFRDHAVLVPIDDAAAWERQMHALLVDGETRRERQRRAGEWARSRTWDAAAGGLRQRLLAAAGSAP